MEWETLTGTESCVSTQWGILTFDNFKAQYLQKMYEHVRYLKSENGDSPSESSWHRIENWFRNHGKWCLKSPDHVGYGASFWGHISGMKLERIWNPFRPFAMNSIHGVSHFGPYLPWCYDPHPHHPESRWHNSYQHQNQTTLIDTKMTVLHTFSRLTIHLAL